MKEDLYINGVFIIITHKIDHNCLASLHILSSSCRSSITDSLLAPLLSQLPRAIHQQVGGVPVPPTRQLKNIFLMHRADLIIITLEPGVPLLPDPAHVVPAVAGPALVGQHRLQQDNAS